jgi:hypothetical protein
MRHVRAIILFVVFWAAAAVCLPATPVAGVEYFNTANGTVRTVTATEYRIERHGFQHVLLVVSGNSVKERWIGPRPRMLLETPNSVVGLFSGIGTLELIDSALQRPLTTGLSDSEAVSKIIDRNTARTFSYDQTFDFSQFAAVAGPTVFLNVQPMTEPSLKAMAPNGSGFGLQLGVKSHGVNAEFRFSSGFQLRGAIVNGKPIPLMHPGFESPEAIATKPYWGSTYPTVIPGDANGDSPSNSPKDRRTEFAAIARSITASGRSSLPLKDKSFVQLYVDKLNLLWIGEQPHQLCVFKDRIYGVYKGGRGRFRVVDNSRTITGVYSNGAELEALRVSLVSGQIPNGRTFEFEVRDNGKRLGPEPEREASLGILEVSESGITLPIAVPEGVGNLTVDPVKRTAKLTGLVGKYTAVVVDEK